MPVPLRVILNALQKKYNTNHYCVVFGTTFTLNVINLIVLYHRLDLNFSVCFISLVNGFAPMDNLSLLNDILNIVMITAGPPVEGQGLQPEFGGLVADADIVRFNLLQSN